MKHHNSSNMRAHWDELAQNYTATREWSLVDSKIVEMLKSNSSYKILEIGFGPAIVAEKIIMEIPKAKYTGLDLSEKFCNMAKKKLGDNIDLLVSDISLPGLKQNQFDTILEMAAIHHFHHDIIPEVVRTIAALLKSGGRFILAEDWGLEPENEREILCKEIRRKKVAHDENTEYHPSDKEWLEMMRLAGLGISQYFHVPRPLSLDFFKEADDIDYSVELSRLKSLWEGEKPSTRMTIIECVKP